jgi:integrase/recombinase XerD
MNHRPQGLNATKALGGFLQYKGAEGLAPITVSGYERDLKLWLGFQGDADVTQITSKQILAFLNYLRNEYVPRRIAGDNSRKLSPKTVLYLGEPRI